jgi:uncharacterized protein (TIGR02145 family)
MIFYRTISILLILFFYDFCSAQVPPAQFNFSGIARDGNSQPIANSDISLQVKIRQSTFQGPEVYSEEHNIVTDEFGLFSIIIGDGQNQVGNVSSVQWPMDLFFLEIGLDVNGGTAFALMGTTQLLSVPYALHAATADSIVGGGSDFTGDYNDLSNKPDLDAINTDNQQLTVSVTGDTLYLQNGGFVLIPGISSVNNPVQISNFEISNVSPISAFATAEFSNISGNAIIQTGFCWSTAPNPTINDWLSINGADPGVITHTIGELLPQNTYYVRAYCLTQDMVYEHYSQQISFTTTNEIISISSGEEISYSGDVYPTVVYGNGQQWMTKNLTTSAFSNGDLIANELLNEVWNVSSEPLWCYYNNDSQYENLYGKLYNNYCALDNRNVCPTGWHVPSMEDWFILIDYLNYDQSIDELNEIISTTAGNSMKDNSSGVWSNPDQIASNISQFSALPSGLRASPANSFINIGENCFFWSSSTIEVTNGVGIMISNNLDGVYSTTTVLPSLGMSIRCMRDY